jgi:membrane associated rhomboid family serine protease
MRSPPGRRASLVPRLTPGVTWLIGVCVGVFLITIFVGEATAARLLDWFALTPSGLARGHVWKLVTSALIHPDPVGFIFGVLMLWFFMPILEHTWGTARLLGFAAATTIVANLAGAGVGLLLGGQHAAVFLGGLAPFVYAGIVAYGVRFARQPVQLFGVLPMTGKAFAIGISVFVTFYVLLTQAWVPGAGYAAAMILAYLLTSGVITPNLWWLRWHRWRQRRRYTVIDGGAGPRDRQKWMN